MTVDNKQFIKDWIEKKLPGQGNPLDDLDPRVTFVIPGAKNNPIFGTFTGIEEVEKFVGLLQAKLQEKGMQQTFNVTDCIAEGDRVLALLEESFTPEHPNSANGSGIYVNHSAWLFRLTENQKIIYLYTYDDTLLTSEALS